jgi:hypothetical protein
MGFWIAFVAGLGIVLLFAGEQFNLRFWQDGRLRRVLTALNPADLRGARVQRRAFVFYLILLTVLYAIIVFLVVIGALAWESGQPLAGGSLPPGSQDGLETALEPWVPLAVSLAITGLSPRAPLLKQIEEKLRAKAHELMGIPSGLEKVSKKIETAELTLDQIGRDFVANADRVRLDRYRRAALLVFGNQAKIDQIERMLLKLVAFRCWLLDDHWPTNQQRFRKLEIELGKDVEALIQDLDALSEATETEAAGPDGGAAADDALAGRQETIRQFETLKLRWDRRVEVMRQLCGEVCALLFVYADRDRQDVVRPAAVDDFFKRVLDSNDGSPDLDILINSIGLATGIAFAWGIAVVMAAPQIGIEPPQRTAALNGLLFALSALGIYGPAMLAAFWWRRLQDEMTMLQVHIFALRRYVLVFLTGTLASLMVLVVFNLMHAIFDVGPTQFQRVWLVALQYAVTLEAPVAVLGGIQGVFVVRYLTLRNELLNDWQGPALVVANGLALLVWSIITVQLKVPQLGYDPTWGDYVIAAPVAGLIGLSIGSLMVVTLVRLPGFGQTEEAR